MTRNASASASTQPLRAAAAAKKADVVRRLHEQMSIIENEIEQANGLYPQGKLNQAELCRRAGISQATLQKPTHVDSTLRDVNAWLKKVATGLRSKVEASKSASDKIALLHEENQDLKQQYHESELELIDAKARIVDLEQKVEKLHEQIAALTARDEQIISIYDAKRKSKQSNF